MRRIKVNKLRSTDAFLICHNGGEIQGTRVGPNIEQKSKWRRLRCKTFRKHAPIAQQTFADNPESPHGAVARRAGRDMIPKEKSEKSD